MKKDQKKKKEGKDKDKVELTRISDFLEEKIEKEKRPYYIEKLDKTLSLFSVDEELDQRDLIQTFDINFFTQLHFLKSSNPKIQNKYQSMIKNMFYHFNFSKQNENESILNQDLEKVANLFAYSYIFYRMEFLYQYDYFQKYIDTFMNFFKFRNDEQRDEVRYALLQKIKQDNTVTNKQYIDYLLLTQIDDFYEFAYGEITLKTLDGNQLIDFNEIRSAVDQETEEEKNQLIEQKKNKIAKVKELLTKLPEIMPKLVELKIKLNYILLQERIKDFYPGSNEDNQIRLSFLTQDIKSVDFLSSFDKIFNASDFTKQLFMELTKKSYDNQSQFSDDFVFKMIPLNTYVHKDTLSKHLFNKEDYNKKFVQDGLKKQTDPQVIANGKSLANTIGQFDDTEFRILTNYKLFLDFLEKFKLVGDEDLTFIKGELSQLDIFVLEKLQFRKVQRASKGLGMFKKPNKNFTGENDNEAEEIMEIEVKFNWIESEFKNKFQEQLKVNEDEFTQEDEENIKYEYVKYLFSQFNFDRDLKNTFKKQEEKIFEKINKTEKKNILSVYLDVSKSNYNLLLEENVEYYKNNIDIIFNAISKALKSALKCNQCQYTLKDSQGRCKKVRKELLIPQCLEYQSDKNKPCSKFNENFYQKEEDKIKQTIYQVPTLKDLGIDKIKDLNNSIEGDEEKMKQIDLLLSKINDQVTPQDQMKKIENYNRMTYYKRYHRLQKGILFFNKDSDFDKIQPLFQQQIQEKEIKYVYSCPIPLYNYPTFRENNLPKEYACGQCKLSQGNELVCTKLVQLNKDNKNQQDNIMENSQFQVYQIKNCYQYKLVKNQENENLKVYKCSKCDSGFIIDKDEKGETFCQEKNEEQKADHCNGYYDKDFIIQGCRKCDSYYEINVKDIGGVLYSKCQPIEKDELKPLIRQFSNNIIFNNKIYLKQKPDDKDDQDFTIFEQSNYQYIQDSIFTSQQDPLNFNTILTNFNAYHNFLSIKVFSYDATADDESNSYDQLYQYFGQMIQVLYDYYLSNDHQGLSYEKFQSLIKVDKKENYNKYFDNQLLEIARNLIQLVYTRYFISDEKIKMQRENINKDTLGEFEKAIKDTSQFEIHFLTKLQSLSKEIIEKTESNEVIFQLMNITNQIQNIKIEQTDIDLDLTSITNYQKEQLIKLLQRIVHHLIFNNYYENEINNIQAIEKPNEETFNEFNQYQKINIEEVKQNIVNSFFANKLPFDKEQKVKDIKDLISFIYINENKVKENIESSLQQSIKEEMAKILKKQEEFNNNYQIYQTELNKQKEELAKQYSKIAGNINTIENENLKNSILSFYNNFLDKNQRQHLSNETVQSMTKKISFTNENYTQQIFLADLEKDKKEEMKINTTPYPLQDVLQQIKDIISKLSSIQEEDNNQKAKVLLYFYYLVKCINNYRDYFEFIHLSSLNESMKKYIQEQNKTQDKITFKLYNDKELKENIAYLSNTNIYGNVQKAISNLNENILQSMDPKVFKDLTQSYYSTIMSGIDLQSVNNKLYDSVKTGLTLMDTIHSKNYNYFLESIHEEGHLFTQQQIKQEETGNNNQYYNQSIQLQISQLLNQNKQSMSSAQESINSSFASLNKKYGHINNEGFKQSLLNRHKSILNQNEKYLAYLQSIIEKEIQQIEKDIKANHDNFASNSHIEQSIMKGAIDKIIEQQNNEYQAYSFIEENNKNVFNEEIPAFKQYLEKLVKAILSQYTNYSQSNSYNNEKGQEVKIKEYDSQYFLLAIKSIYEYYRQYPMRERNLLKLSVRTQVFINKLETGEQKLNSDLQQLNRVNKSINKIQNDVQAVSGKDLNEKINKINEELQKKIKHYQTKVLEYNLKVQFNPKVQDYQIKNTADNSNATSVHPDVAFLLNKQPEIQDKISYIKRQLEQIQETKEQLSIENNQYRNILQIKYREAFEKFASQPSIQDNITQLYQSILVTKYANHFYDIIFKQQGKEEYNFILDKYQTSELKQKVKKGDESIDIAIYNIKDYKQNVLTQINDKIDELAEEGKDKLKDGETERVEEEYKKLRIKLSDEFYSFIISSGKEQLAANLSDAKKVIEAQIKVIDEEKQKQEELNNQLNTEKDEMQISILTQQQNITNQYIEQLNKIKESVADYNEKYNKINQELNDWKEEEAKEKSNVKEQSKNIFMGYQKFIDSSKQFDNQMNAKLLEFRQKMYAFQIDVVNNEQNAKVLSIQAYQNTIGKLQQEIMKLQEQQNEEKRKQDEEIQQLINKMNESPEKEEQDKLLAELNKQYSLRKEKEEQFKQEMDKLQKEAKENQEKLNQELQKLKEQEMKMRTIQQQFGADDSHAISKQESEQMKKKIEEQDNLIKELSTKKNEEDSGNKSMIIIGAAAVIILLIAVIIYLIITKGNGEQEDAGIAQLLTQDI